MHKVHWQFCVNKVAFPVQYSTGVVYILADQTDIDSPSSISLVRTRPFAVRDKHQKLVEQDPSWKYIFTLHYRTKLFDFFYSILFDSIARACEILENVMGFG